MMLALVSSEHEMFEIELQGNRIDIEINHYSAAFIQLNGKWNIRLPHQLINKDHQPVTAGSRLNIADHEGNTEAVIWFYEIPETGYCRYALQDYIELSICSSKDSSGGALRIDTKTHHITADTDTAAVNGIKQTDVVYHIGDVLLSVNLKIIFGPDFLMIRSPDTFNLPLYESRTDSALLNRIVWKKDYYLPKPQLMTQVMLKEPERVHTVETDQMFLLMMPSIMMLLMSSCVGLVNAYRNYMNGRELLEVLPSFLLPFVMLVSTLLSSPLYRWSRKRKNHKERMHRDAVYQSYLDDQKDLILRQYEENQSYLAKRYPSHHDLIQMLQAYQIPDCSDAYSIGCINAPLPVTAEADFENESDQLTEMIRSLKECLLSHRKQIYIIQKGMHIRMEGRNAESLFTAVLFKVGICRKDAVLFCSQQFLNRYPFVKRLPGLYQNGIRHIYTEEPTQFNRGEHYVVCADFAGMIDADVRLSEEHYHADIIIHVDQENWLFETAVYKKYEFIPDSFQNACMGILFPEGIDTHKIDNSFLNLYHLNTFSDLNIKERWRHHEGNGSLEMCIGLDEAGHPVILDLSEKKHGPHGLIAGMTGSGKSELILTMLLSSMVEYSPLDLQIAFIDFKGGGAMQVFHALGRKMPHVIGTLSNLDENAADRALYALHNECRRRQICFHEASKKYRESIMNLSDYRMIRRDNPSIASIADLIIVVDEFAELKAQRPEFLNELISIARIGRSLGIHLILCTQKPAGVINEQIWSNSHFKICMKVAEKQDSMEVLHCPDALDLNQAGQFILECDGHFTKGIAGYSGFRSSKQNIALEILDLQGKRYDAFESYGKYHQPQNIEAAREILNAWNDQKIIPPLWSEPLSRLSFKNMIQQKAIVQCDDYYHQQQPYIQLQLRCGTHWAFLCPYIYVKQSYVYYLLCLIMMQKEQYELFVIDDQENMVYLELKKIKQCRAVTASSNVMMKEINTYIRTKAERLKIILVLDASRFYENISAWNMRDLLEHASEYNLMFLFFISSAASMPYRDQNYVRNRIALKNDNIDDLTSFLGCRVKGSVKGKDEGLINSDVLLECRIPCADEKQFRQVIAHITS